jgi:hypothetical protein
MRRVCTGTQVHYKQTVREREARLGGGCGECVPVHWYTMSRQTGHEWPGSVLGSSCILAVMVTCTPVHYGQIVSELVAKQGRRMRRACMGTPEQYERTAWDGWTAVPSIGSARERSSEFFHVPQMAVNATQI